MAETILVVEDEPNDALLLRRAFGKAHLDNPIQVVPEGEAAIAYLSGEAPYVDRNLYPLPALMLLDLKLPRMSGFEVLVWLRQQPGLKRLPVVVLTSSGQKIDVDRAYELGASSYLVKPVSFEELLVMVKALNLYWSVLCMKPDIVSR